MDNSNNIKDAEKMLLKIVNEISATYTEFNKNFTMPQPLKNKKYNKIKNAYRNYQAKGTWNKLK